MPRPGRLRVRKARAPAAAAGRRQLSAPGRRTRCGLQRATSNGISSAEVLRRNSTSALGLPSGTARDSRFCSSSACALASRRSSCCRKAASFITFFWYLARAREQGLGAEAGDALDALAPRNVALLRPRQHVLRIPPHSHRHAGAPAGRLLPAGGAAQQPQAAARPRSDLAHSALHHGFPSAALGIRFERIFTHMRAQIEPPEKGVVCPARAACGGMKLGRARGYAAL